MTLTLQKTPRWQKTTHFFKDNWRMHLWLAVQLAFWLCVAMRRHLE